MSGTAEDCHVRLCDKAGNVLQSAPIEAGRAALTVDGAADKSVCVKLCRENLLLDLAAVPEAR